MRGGRTDEEELGDGFELAEVFLLDDSKKAHDVDLNGGVSVQGGSSEIAKNERC